MSDLRKTFETETMKTLMAKMGVKNVMAVPRLKKIVLNESTKEFLGDKKNMEKAREELQAIAGQKPKTTRARTSIATFKLREGDEIGLTVTLRGKRMYDFFEKLVKIVLPRVRDFNGVADSGFDGRGNFTMGFTESTVFSEIDPGKVDKVRTLQVTIVTSAEHNEHGKLLLETMGFPFKKKPVEKATL